MKKKVKKEIKKGKFKNFLVENYSKSWEYIKESKNFIWAAVIIFFVGVFLGFLFQPAEITKTILDYIQQVLTKTEGMNSGQMIRFIFLNNLQIGFMALIYGFALGIFPILSIFANGYVVGFVSSSAISSAGAVSLLNLLPHGIFELPAIFISFGLGIKFGISLLSYSIKYFYPKISRFELRMSLLLAILLAPVTFITILILLIFKKNFRENFFNLFGYLFTGSMRVFIFVVLPLLIIAAIIEGYLISFLK